MAQFPDLPLYTDAWGAGTRHLPGPVGRQKRCLYDDLIVLMWRSPDCRVPNTDTWLADHLDLAADEVTELIRPVIREFCQSDGNWITQKRLRKEFVRAFERAGRLSALHHRRKNNGSTLNGGRSSADDELQTNGNLYLNHNSNLSYFGE